jgi:hypothetical protein
MACDKSCGKPGLFAYYELFTETLRSLSSRIEQFGLASADELQLDTLVAREVAVDGSRSHHSPHSTYRPTSIWRVDTKAG